MSTGITKEHNLPKSRGQSLYIINLNYLEQKIGFKVT